MMKKLTVALLVIVFSAGAAFALSPKDVSRIKDGAACGDPLSQFKLGYMFETGTGVAQDYSEAFKWYSSAAANGHPCAQYYVALMYIDGRGVEKDECSAVKWLRKSAAKGNVNAQYLFGRKVYFGEGVAQNETAGLKWLRAAACKGHADARKFLDKYYADQAAAEARAAFLRSNPKPVCGDKKIVAKPAKKFSAKKAPARRVSKVRKARPAAASKYCW